MPSKVTKSSRLAGLGAPAWAAARPGARSASVSQRTPSGQALVRIECPASYTAGAGLGFARRPTGIVDTVVACETCGLVQRLEGLGPGLVAECARCGAQLADHKPNSLARTAAFSLAALLFYVPANIFPILEMDLYGVHSENTVWEGCKTLFQHGEILVAVVVF